MKSPFAWLNERIPNGVYATGVRRVVTSCHSRLSAHERLKRHVRGRLGIMPDQKTPAWFTEFYQMAWIVIEVWCLLCSRSSWLWLAYGAAALALYRVVDISLFATRWVFVDERPVHSYRRSLVGFLINIAEIVICFAVAGVALECVSGSSRWQAVYSSLRTTVTIGPLSTLEPARNGCIVLTIAQIGISYFLAAVVIAATVGSIGPRHRAPMR